MSLDVVGCCKKPPFWIFVYNTDNVYSICQDHFYSVAHRCNVKDVVNFQTKIHYDPETIFSEHPIRYPSIKEVSSIV